MVKFSKENPILLTGDAIGDLDVYRLYGYDDASRDHDVQRDKLIKIIAPAGYQNDDKDAQAEWSYWNIICLISIEFVIYFNIQ